MHIGIVVWSLFESRGGIQEFGVNLAHAMLSRGHKVTIFSRWAPEHSLTPLYAIDPAILVEILWRGKSASPSSDIYPVLEKSREKLVSSDIDVLAALFSWKALLLFPALLRNSGIPLIISEHNNPDIIDNERWNAYERHACLAAADRIHVLSPDYAAKIPEFLRERTIVIPNPGIPLQAAKTTPKSDGGRKLLLAAGRFADSHKQFSLLIRAFSTLLDRFPDWDLTICGAGPDEKRYRRLARQLRLGGRIHFPGMSRDMGAWYEKADLLCIPSRFEGFPLVPLEAYGHALPVVGFSQCSGVNEIVIDGENGLLAQEMTAECLAQSLARMMENRDMRQRLGLRGRDMLSRYAPDAIFDQWENLFRDAARLKGATILQQPSFSASEKDRVHAALDEILSRPTPFRRFDFRETEKLEQRLKTFKNAWFRRVLSRSWRVLSFIQRFWTSRQK